MDARQLRGVPGRQPETARPGELLPRPSLPRSPRLPGRIVRRPPFLYPAFDRQRTNANAHTHILANKYDKNR
jgi:hypothetical protein